MKISQAKRRKMNRCVSPLKQKEAWGSWEKIRNECNWCMVNHGEKEAMEVADGNWARIF